MLISYPSVKKCSLVYNAQMNFSKKDCLGRSPILNSGRVQKCAIYKNGIKKIPIDFFKNSSKQPQPIQTHTTGNFGIDFSTGRAFTDIKGDLSNLHYKPVLLDSFHFLSRMQGPFEYLIKNLIKKSRNIPYSILLVYINIHYRFFFSYCMGQMVSELLAPSYWNPIKKRSKKETCHIQGRTSQLLSCASLNSFAIKSEMLNSAKNNLIKNTFSARELNLKSINQIRKKLNPSLWQLTRKRHNQNSLHWIFKKYWLNLNHYTQNQVNGYQYEDFYNNSRMHLRGFTIPVDSPLYIKYKKGSYGDKIKKYKTILFFKNILKISNNTCTSLNGKTSNNIYKIILNKLVAYKGDRFKNLKPVNIAKTNQYLFEGYQKHYFFSLCLSTKWVRTSNPSNKKFVNFFKFIKKSNSLTKKKRTLFLQTYYIHYPQ